MNQVDARSVPTLGELAERIFDPASARRARRTLPAAVLAAPVPHGPDWQYAVFDANPASRPATGMMLYIPPWDDAVVPQGYAEAAARHRLALVVPSRSGNATPDLADRIPRALAALESARARYGFAPGSAWIGGFSGGSRAALRIALAYPDLFAGALLDSGVDTLGTRALPEPAPGWDKAALARLVVVHSVGSADRVNRAREVGFARSARAHGLTAPRTLLRKGAHAAMPAADFARALAALLVAKDPAQPAE